MTVVEALDAIVCGLGPSVRGWHAPEGVCIFGVNDIARHLTPYHLVVVDRPDRFSDDRRKVIESTRGRVAWMASPGGWRLSCSIVKHLELDNVNIKEPLQVDGPHIPQYQTSPFAATALAFQLGFRRIGIIGVDLIDHKLAPRVAKIDAMFGKLRSAIAERGAQLFNLSSISLLHSLPRIS